MFYSQIRNICRNSYKILVPATCNKFQNQNSESIKNSYFPHFASLTVFSTSRTQTIAFSGCCGTVQPTWIRFVNCYWGKQISNSFVFRRKATKHDSKYELLLSAFWHCESECGVALCWCETSWRNCSYVTGSNRWNEMPEFDTNVQSIVEKCSHLGEPCVNHVIIAGFRDNAGSSTSFIRKEPIA